MKFRLGACAAVVLLAACSGQKSDSQMAALHGSAGGDSLKSQARSAMKPSGRDIRHSIASAPDRGALMAYKNQGKPVKREGAFTYYPVAMSEDHALKGVVTGHMTVPMPDGSEVKLNYERHDEGIDGNWTWVGRVEGGDPMQEAIITFGEEAVFASIPQGAGKPPLNIRTQGGSLYAVQMDPSKVRSPNIGHNDMAVPEASTLRDAMAGQILAAKAQISQKAVAQAAPPSATNTIDVAIGYTVGFRNKAQLTYGGVTTALTFLVQVANQGFSNSNINGYLRLVNAQEVSYREDNANQTALQELTGSNGVADVAVSPALVPLRTAREQYGADIALLIRGFQQPEHQGCGVAWLIGAKGATVNPVQDARWGYGVVSFGDDTGNDGNSYYCPPESMIHEVGHLLGSAHDQANSVNAPGRYPYSYGYKSVAGNFYTIMAYGDPGQTPHRIFSNPNITTCGPSGNMPCGVADQADNARSINQTLPIVASFRLPIAPFSERIVSQDKFGMNQDGRADIFWRSTNTAFAYWLMNGSSVISTRTVDVGVPNAYSQIGRGDLNGDGYADILWTSDSRDIWLWSGTGTSFNAQFVAGYPEGWSPIAVIDVNGDGRSDIIFRNITTSRIAIWLMNGRVATTVYNAYAEVPATYSLAGTGDFNGDGRGDLLWTSSKLDLWMWTSNGADFVPAFVSNYPSPWRPVGTGDVNGDGRSDILWRNSNSSQVAYWLMNGSTVVTTRNASALAPSNYWIAGVGDYNGDGRADIVWTSTGRDLWNWQGNGVDFSPTFVDNYPVGWSPEPSGP